MKTNFARQCSLGLVAGLVFFAGCARPSAQPDQPKSVSASTVPTPTPPVLAPAGTAAPQVANGAPAPGVADTNAPAIIERIPPSAKPGNVQMSPGLSEVVKLAQAGVGEDVILAFVEKYSAQFDVGSDQILYLNDLGVAETVITSMLKHDGSPVPAVAASPSPAQTQALSNVPQTQVTEETTPPTVSTSVAPPPTSTEVSYFYDTLSPYGSWIYLSGYGWCWQPTVAASVSTWRPYCDRGRWYWSDAGWYWSSDYSWGWAAFHYGRWYDHPGCGWVWTPGIVWAPSWVSWRYTDGYCGWAPLPPEACFVSGVGFTYYGRHVAVGFDFGLHDYHYSFVHVNNFCDYAPYRYVVPHGSVQNFYRNTTVINNYIVRNNNTVINQGIGREAIARASQTRVREVSIRETPVSNMAHVQGDRIDKQGHQMVVYRPQLPKTPPTVRSAQFNRTGGAGQSVATVGRAANTGPGAVVPSGPSHGGAGRGQSGVAARSTTGTSVEPARPPSNANDERNRTTAAPRGNANSAERSGRKVQPSLNPQSARPQREQPRANGPLFGSGTATTLVQPQNNVAARTMEPRAAQPQIPRTQAQPQTQVPRVQSQPAQTQRSYSPPVPTYPQVQQPAVRRENQSSGRYSDHTTSSPRQQEQLPHYSSPAYQTPPSSAPQSRPSNERSPAPQSGGGERVRSAPSGGGGSGGGGRSEAAPSRGERSR